MAQTMVMVLCPSCGRRLLSTKVNKMRPRIYLLTDDEHPPGMDTKLKCPRCKAIIGIDK